MSTATFNVPDTLPSSVGELRSLCRANGWTGVSIAGASKEACITFLTTGERPAASTGAPSVTVAASAAESSLASLLRAEAVQQVSAAIDAELERYGALVRPTIINIPERAEPVIIQGASHRQFSKLVRFAAAKLRSGHRLNIWLAGGPGWAKTSSAAKLSESLDIGFYSDGALLSKYELLGFVDAGGKYHRTQFRDAWEHGGVYLADEVDRSDPSATIALNSALANGWVVFSDGKRLDRHPDCIILGSANTTGYGATAEFSAAVRQDGAFLDRFVFIGWGEDDDFERAICGVPARGVGARPEASTSITAEDWVTLVQSCRRVFAELGIRQFVTPRASLNGIALLEAGASKEDCIGACLRKGLTDADWDKVTARLAA